MSKQIIRHSSNELHIYIYEYTKPDDELNTYAKPTLVTLPHNENKTVNTESNKLLLWLTKWNDNATL